MKKSATAAAILTLPLAVSAADNLVTNGSFESGLASWTQSSTAGTVYDVATITYALPGAFGEAIPLENSGVGSPDAAGANVAYFVDDNTTQELSTEITVPFDGMYNVGFAYYLPANGFLNAGGATFSAQFGPGYSTPSVSLGSLSPTTWYVSEGAAMLSAGVQKVSFTFETTGGQSKDIVIDRVFVTAVPEPETAALMLAGLLGVGFLARRRRD